ncbi:MAG: DegV family protein [Anaerolineae bacterium]
MPNKIRIVTDSSAQFIREEVIARYEITVIPLNIVWDGQLFREGIDVLPDEFYARLVEKPVVPHLLPPTIEHITAVYQKLAATTDQILSIHLSGLMHNTVVQAKKAAEPFLGRVNIQVVDSQSIAVNLGALVEKAAELAEQHLDMDEVVHTIRKIIPRMYAVFQANRLEYLRAYNLMSESQAILGSMLGIKPIVTIEDGELQAIEKSCSPQQSIDRLVEFVTEFEHFEHVMLFQGEALNQPNDLLQAVIDRLKLEFRDQEYPLMRYNPSLACFIGPDASGAMVLEAEDALDNEN